MTLRLQTVALGMLVAGCDHPTGVLVMIHAEQRIDAACTARGRAARRSPGLRVEQWGLSHYTNVRRNKGVSRGGHQDNDAPRNVGALQGASTIDSASYPLARFER
jgi:hypothetical protein